MLIVSWTRFRQIFNISANKSCRLGIKFAFKSFAPAKEKYESYYEPKRSASVYVNDVLIGCIGEIKYGVLSKLKLPRGVAAFEISLDQLIKFTTLKKSIAEISDYPTVSRDITIVTDEPYETVFNKLQEKLEKRDLVFSIKPTSIYQAEGAPSLSFHLEFSDRTKTLDAAEIQDIMSDLEN